MAKKILVCSLKTWIKENQVLFPYSSQGHFYPFEWYQCIVSEASKNFEKHNIHIQSHKLNGSILKYGKLVYFQNVVNL